MSNLHRFILTPTLVLGLAFAAACSDDDDDGGGGDVPSPTPTESATPAPTETGEPTDSPAPTSTEEPTQEPTDSPEPTPSGSASPTPTGSPAGGICAQCETDEDCATTAALVCGGFGASCVCDAGRCLSQVACNPPCTENQRCELGGPAGGTPTCVDNCTGDEGTDGIAPCGGFFPFCAESGNCVACVEDADCAGDPGGENCHPDLNFCFNACSSDDDCNLDPNATSCGEDGVCRSLCTEDADCEFSGVGPVCDTATGQCGCGVDADCQDGDGEPLMGYIGTCQGAE